MKVTAKHAEAVGESPAIGMEERFFLNGIALYAAYIAPGYVKRPSTIETDFADTDLPVCNGTAMSARIAADAVAVELLVQLRGSFPDVPFQNFLQGWHKKLRPCTKQEYP